MKLPNGFGSIYKLSGKRRKPYRATITVGYKDNGSQIRRTIGYFETRTDAINALTEYHEDPQAYKNKDILFKDLYNIFYKRKENENLSESSMKAYDYVYSKCTSLENRVFAELRTEDYLNLMEAMKMTYSIKKKFKILLSQMYDVAIENDLMNKNYADFIKVRRSDNDVKHTKNIFTKEEIDLLFEKAEHIKNCDTILMMIYSGIRVGELLKIKKTDVDLEDHSFIAGIKTEAGKNRYIPIHDKIYPFFKRRLEMDLDSEYLIVGTKKDEEYNYRTYRDTFDIAMEQLGMKHTPHECRHTFATLMDNAGANKNSITKIIGHTSYVTTSKFYTHKDKDELKKAISNI